MLTAKDLGAQSAYPSDDAPGWMGMTYHQWLVGQAMLGLSRRIAQYDTTIREHEVRDAAHLAIRLANETLEALAKDYNTKMREG